MVKKDLEIAQLTTKVTQLNRLNQELKASLDQWQNRYEAEQERINQVSNGVAQSVRDLQKQLADLDVDGVRLKSVRSTDGKFFLSNVINSVLPGESAVVIGKSKDQSSTIQQRSELVHR